MADQIEDEKPKKKSRGPITIKLEVPVILGEENVEQLVLKPTARAFKELSVPMSGDGKMFYEPYALANVGVRMAGQTTALVDKLDPADMSAIAQAVLGFLS